MTATPATRALDRAGIAYRTHSYRHDPASKLSYGLAAAASLGLPPEAVFKTLVASVDGPRGPGLAVAVLPILVNLDLKAFAQALGVKKASMADPTAAQRSSGYVTGGISPVGQRVSLPTLIDASARSLPLIYVSGGKRGLTISLHPADLATITRAEFAQITR